MSLRDGLNTYYASLGVRGVFSIFSYRLFGWPKEIVAYPPGAHNPVYIRTRTTDVSLYRQVLLHGEYDFDLPFDPKIIIDAGANTGMTSIYFANRYPGAKVIAVEAEAANFAMLARNVRPYPSIVPIHAALWNRDGEISVGEPDPATGASGEWGFVTREGPGAKVRAMTMRTLMQEAGAESADLVKMDIEGAEMEAFEDSTWSGGLKCLMIELHDRFRRGCAEAVEPAMRNFTRAQRGETILYLANNMSSSDTGASSAAVQ